LIKKNSYKSGLIQSTFLNVFAKCIGFINVIIITSYFGAKTETDIYYYIISVTGLVCTLINGIDLYILIPETMRIREQISEIASRKFINSFLFYYLIIGVFIVCICIINPIQFYSLFTKFEKQKLQQHFSMLQIGGILIILQLIISLLSSILISYKYFTITIIGALINSVATVLSTIFLHQYFGILSTLIGLLIGNIINLLFLIYLFIKKLNWQFSQILIVKDKKLFTNIGLLQINILPVWIRNYLIIYLISGLGEGYLTSLNIATTLAAIPETFLLSQIIAIGGIKLSELNSLQDYDGAKNMVYNLFTTLFLVIVPIAIVASICSLDIITILFSRGKFKSENATMVAFCFFYMMLLLPSKISDSLYSRLFTSFQVIKTSVLYGFVGHVCFTILSYVMITYLKIEGHFIALLIGSYIIMPIVFMIILKKTLPVFLDKRIIRFLLITLVVSFVTYFTTILGFSLLAQWLPFFRITIVSTYVFSLFFLGMFLFTDVTFIKSIIQEGLLKLKLIK
jgi:putative peptidoglycan lipid II flippase